MVVVVVCACVFFRSFSFSTFINFHLPHPFSPCISVRARAKTMPVIPYLWLCVCLPRSRSQPTVHPCLLHAPLHAHVYKCMRIKRMGQQRGANARTRHQPHAPRERDRGGHRNEDVPTARAVASGNAWNARSCRACFLRDSFELAKDWKILSMWRDSFFAQLSHRLGCVLALWIMMVKKYIYTNKYSGTLTLDHSQFWKVGRVPISWSAKHVFSHKK